MSKNFVKYYPVDNGDTSLIKLKDNVTLLIDVNIRESETNSDGNDIFDVKTDLIECIEKNDGNYFLNHFILSHADEDHCLGFEKNFYQGDPKEYGESNQENDEIIIDELWVTSLIFSNDLCSDAKAIKKEAKRRLKLIEDDSSEKDDFGNKIKLIGYDGNERYEDVPNHIPGESVEISDYLELFIHAPFKSDLIESRADKDRNASSIVFQARIKNKSTDDEPTAKLIFGGDADHYRWKKILKISEEKENEDKLEWDILLAPHHCSWSFFNDVPYDDKENQEPKDYSLEFLDYGQDDSKIIASCKKIKKEKPNPPHEAAKDEYIDKLDSKENFFNTSTHPKEKTPEPIIFEIGKSIEKQETESEKKSRAAKEIAKAGVVKKPWRI
jgi:hypothetical protein